ncbi:MAG: hypothetical protein NTX61_08215 [Bacteroidetes bacterium]|nr:hypothetical protein [Bacteroidota bacterium]
MAKQKQGTDSLKLHRDFLQLLIQEKELLTKKLGDGFIPQLVNAHDNVVLALEVVKEKQRLIKIEWEINRATQTIKVVEQSQKDKSKLKLVKSE